MSWLEEAQKIIEKKQTDTATSSAFSCLSEAEREVLKKKLRSLYDNATEREIDKAIDQALEKVEKPYEEKAFMAFLRTKLED